MPSATAHMKPHIRLADRESWFAIKDMLRIPRSDCYEIDFPALREDEFGVRWWAHTCEYVKASIRAWHRAGPDGLIALERARYPRND